MSKNTSEKALNRLVTLGRDILTDINSDKSPSFYTPVRARGNIHFNPEKGILMLGDNREKRTFVHVSQAKKFMQTVSIAAKLKTFLEQGLHTSIRGLYYQLKFSLGDELDEELFSEQSESNPLIEDLEASLDLMREDFNLSTDRKGVVAGNMIIKDKYGGEENIIDASQQGRSGWMIPSDVDNDIEFVNVNVDYVLVVEKDAIWQRLNEDKFWKKNNCLLITPKGQASRGTRRLIRKLADMGLPVYVFTDCDAWGWYIYWAIKTGSMNLAYITKHLATPEARFLGVTMSDIEEYEFLQKLTIKTKEVDIKRAEEMKSYPWISKHPEWVKELDIVLTKKKKIEQDALQGEKLTFVGEYVRDKIKNKKYLP